MKNKIYIGDNLKIMNNEDFKKEYENKINMIYIDPPYNTGKTFSYKDKIDKEAWKLFMNDRLIAAKEIMKNNSCIFISIDDNQYADLKILCDNIFNPKNFVGTFITHQAQRSNAKHINTVHEYILCYAKNKKELNEFKIKRINIPEQKKMIDYIIKSVKNDFKNDKLLAQNTLSKLIKRYCEKYNISWLKNYCNIDENGEIYFAKDLSTPSNPREVNIPEIELYLEALPTRGWSSDKKLIELHNTNRLVYKGKRPYEKHYLIEAEDNVPSMLNYYSRQGTSDLKNLGLQDLFDTPKPVELIKFLIRISTQENDTILDFFAGSGTTAQAIYEINKEDNTNRKYILMQLNEDVNKNSKAFSICKEKGIKPIISEILKYRINTYLKVNKIDIDYLTYNEMGEEIE